LEGDHYHDGTLGKGFAAGGDPTQNLTLFGRGYLREQFLKKLQEWSIPAHDKSGDVKVGGIGIAYATIAVCSEPIPELLDPTGQTDIPQLAGGRGTFGAGQWGVQQRTFRLNRKDNRDRGRRNEGAINSALNDFNLADPSQDPDQKTKSKREKVNRTHFIIQFAWTPEKPRPNPAAKKGSLASAAAPAGAKGPATPVSASPATKK
jgi:hypothetical protein